MELKKWLPNVMTLLLAAVLVVTQQVWAGPLVERLTAASEASSKSTINYQGYLTEAGGESVNDTLDMVFRLYNVASGGEALWAENHNDVPVTDGLFSVLLGGSASNPNPIPASLFVKNASLWLGVSVGGDAEMMPREQLSSASFAMYALRPELVRPNWYPAGTCVNLIQELRDRGYSQCTYVASAGSGYKPWFRTNDCSGTGYEEPTLWQKDSIWKLQEREPTRLKVGCCNDQMPFLICK